MKRNILLSLLLFLSISIWAQKKVKFPKTLKQTWVTKQIPLNEWEEEQNSTITIEDQVIYIEEDGFYGYNDWLYEGDYSFTESAESYNYNYENDYVYNEEDDVANEEGLHTILSHTKWSKTNGVFLLQYTDYGTKYYRLLGYDQLDKDKVTFLIGYDFYSQKEAEEAMGHMKGKFVKYGYSYFAKDLFDEYKNLPVLSDLNESDYLIWWGRYIEEAKKSNVELSLGIDEDVPQGFLQNLFLNAGFNPFDSPSVFVSAIDKYGVNEEVRTLIRGEVSESQKLETRQLLNTNWYSMTGYGGPTEIQISETEFYFKIIEGDHNEEVLKMPVADMVIGMTPQEGTLIIGPAPDSIRAEAGFEYALLHFRNLNAASVELVPGDIAETLSEARKKPIIFPKFGSALKFISQSKYDEYALLPALEIILEKEEFSRWEIEMETYMDSLERRTDINNYGYVDIYAGDYMFNFFLSKGYNPIKSIGNLESSRQYFQAIDNVEYYREYLKDYQEELQEARRNNDLEEQRRIEQDIEEYKMEVVIAEMRVKAVEAEMNGDLETKQRIDAQLDSFYELQDVRYSLDNAIYYKDEIQRILEEMENGSIYLDEDYYDYEYYVELVKEYPNHIDVALVEVKDALSKIKPSDELAPYIKTMERQVSVIEEYSLVMDEEVISIIELARQKDAE